MKKIASIFFCVLYFPCVALSQLPTALFTGNNYVCPGTCTGFTNTSINATSYLWIFESALPSTSTDPDPFPVCYNMQGTYDVTLIAYNGNGSDTLYMPDYITVYPLPPGIGITQTNDTLSVSQGFASYQWYFNGILVPGATDYFYVVPGNGDVNVVATDTNGCQVEALIIWFDLPKNDFQNQFIVYPNPADQFVTVGSAFGASAAEVSIYNMVGEKVMTVLRTVANAGPWTIDVSALSPGMYWLETDVAGKILCTRFLKQ